MIRTVVSREHLNSEPLCESDFVSTRANSKTERLPDLRTMRTTGPLTPPVARKLADVDMILPCDEGDHVIAELR